MEFTPARLFVALSNWNPTVQDQATCRELQVFVLRYASQSTDPATLRRLPAYRLRNGQFSSLTARVYSAPGPSPWAAESAWDLEFGELFDTLLDFRDEPTVQLLRFANAPRLSVTEFVLSLVLPHTFQLTQRASLFLLTQLVKFTASSQRIRSR